MLPDEVSSSIGDMDSDVESLGTDHGLSPADDMKQSPAGTLLSLGDDEVSLPRLGDGSGSDGGDGIPDLSEVGPSDDAGDHGAGDESPGRVSPATRGDNKMSTPLLSHQPGQGSPGAQGRYAGVDDDDGDHMYEEANDDLEEDIGNSRDVAPAARDDESAVENSTGETGHVLEPSDPRAGRVDGEGRDDGESGVEDAVVIESGATSHDGSDADEGGSGGQPDSGDGPSGRRLGRGNSGDGHGENALDDGDGSNDDGAGTGHGEPLKGARRHLGRRDHQGHNDGEGRRPPPVIVDMEATARPEPSSSPTRRSPRPYTHTRRRTVHDSLMTWTATPVKGGVSEDHQDWDNVARQQAQYGGEVQDDYTTFDWNADEAEMRHQLRSHVAMAMRDIEMRGEEFSCPEFTPAMKWFNLPAPDENQVKEVRSEVTRRMSAGALRDELYRLHVRGSGLQMAGQLAGKIVVMGLWDLTCVESWAMVEALNSVANEWRDEPAVEFVFVHSPRVAGARAVEVVRHATMRLGIERPVVHDSNRRIVDSIGIASLPTVAVVGPSGTLILLHPGVDCGVTISRLIDEALDYFAPRQRLNRKAINKSPMIDQYAREQADRRVQETAQRDALLRETLLRYGTGAEVPPAPQLFDRLLYPTKIAMDPEHGRLFISDTGNNRIVVVTVSGKFLHAIGSGDPGMADGAFGEAQFRAPMGVLYHKQSLFIADTFNHALRRVDLKTKIVTTLAGDGQPASRDYVGGETGAAQRLNYPVDVAIRRDNTKNVYIAMAGNNQLWTYSRKSGAVRAFSGFGREMVLNSPDPREAGWAQPRGIHASGSILYIADTTSHCIRGIDFDKGGRSWNLVGSEARAPDRSFHHGDRDSTGKAARLQCPLAVVHAQQRNKLIISDSLNHKLRFYNINTGSVVSWAGNGKPGYSDGRGLAARFNCPDGMVLDGEGRTVFVVDTNNHQIRTVDLFSGEVNTLPLEGVPAGKLLTRLPVEPPMDDEHDAVLRDEAAAAQALLLMDKDQASVKDYRRSLNPGRRHVRRFVNPSVSWG